MKNMLIRIRNKYLNSKVLFLLVLFISIAIGILDVYLNISYLPKQEVVSVNRDVASNQNYFLDIGYSKGLSQNFRLQENVTSIAIYFSNSDVNKANINLKLDTEGLVFFDESFEIQGYTDEQEITIPIDSDITSDKVVTLSVNQTNPNVFPAKVKLGIVMNDEYIYEGSLKLNESILVTQYSNKRVKSVETVLSMIVVVVVVAFSLLTFFYLQNDKSKILKVFFGTLIASGVMFMIVFPPYSVPDEYYHIRASYGIATGVMYGSDDVRRETDFDAFDGFNYLNNSSYMQLISDLDYQVSDTLVPFENTIPLDPISYLQYFPSTIGILVSFLLKLDFIYMVYLSRILNLVFFSFAAYLSLRINNSINNIIYFVCFLPMTLHLVSSFSYDVFIISMTLIYYSFIFKMLYLNEKLDKRNLFYLFILTLLLVPNKVIVYLPIVLISLNVILKKVKIHRYKIALSLLLLSLITIIIFNFGWFQRLFSTSDEVVKLIYDGREGFTFSWILNNPIDFLEIIFFTFKNFSVYYINTLIGTSLSWFNINLSAIWQVFYILLFSISSMRSDESTDSNLFGISSFIVVIVLFSSTLLIYLSMLLLHTPLGSLYVQGVQGRYFIPLLPLLMYGFSKIEIRLKTDLNSSLLLVYFTLSVLIVLDAFNVIIQRI